MVPALRGLPRLAGQCGSRLGGAPGAAQGAQRLLLRSLAAGRPLRGPRFTDEQIKELSKYDAVLAQQIKTARDNNLAVEWKDLDHMPMQEMPVWSNPMTRKEEKKEGIIDMLKTKLLGAPEKAK
mmetsp:Transcript_56615/g.113678  ORF Transcript_56615/g.113678 Transcript_56615/m.113678 type:complete len:124 (+) Transcript_56615:2-373(+)